MKQVQDTVTVNFTDVKGNKSPVIRPVSWLEFETVDDILAAAQIKEQLETLIKNANYGANLKARAAMTQQIKTENQGPEVAVNRLLAQMKRNHEKSNKPFDEAKKRAFIMANLEDFGISIDGPVAEAEAEVEAAAEVKA